VLKSTSQSEIDTQIEGRGFSSPIEAARKEFLSCGAFQNLTLRYVQAQLLQAAQSAGCNAKHNMEQRLSRWLLLCADRAHSNMFKLSQEFLADMLGSTRPTISLAAGVLKEQGLIDYARGVIRILDVKRLEQTSCECYRIIKNYLDNYAAFDTGFTA
jgi:hypothetical protein